MGSRFQKCRLCLKLGDFCSIFEQDDCIKLSDMVMSFTNIRIYEGDGLPDRVCTTCIENLSTAYLFKQQCERINKMLIKSPEIMIDQPDGATDFNQMLNREFHMHHNESAEGENNENNQNTAKDASSNSDTYHTPLSHDVSDETDSDVESVKCVYCSKSYNNIGGHTCHVTCQIEHNQLQQSSSSETLVAADASAYLTPPEILNKSNSPLSEKCFQVSCVLCDEKYDQYEAYAAHLNKCTSNVRLHHYVCPVCHEIYTFKQAYLDHLKTVHFRCYTESDPFTDTGEDCVDFAPIIEKTRRPKAVRRQIGWSVEDIYQEIECKKVEEKPTPTSSPLKSLFAKFGNESFSRQSTPKKVSFRKWIETSKEKTANYLPFRKYIQNYKMKKSISNYSPIKGKTQVTSRIQASLPGHVSDSDYHSPSGTSEESWKLKQNLICACDKKVFMISEFIKDRERIAAMINELGGVVAENTKMEMLATHFIAVLPDDTCTGMMVCAVATGKWLLHIGFVYDSFRCKKFLREEMYEWMKHPKILELDDTSVEVTKAAVYWHLELQALNAKFPFEGKQIVLIMKKKYRQYYQMIFKTLKAKTITYDPRTPGSCCTADYCFVDMKVIERVKLRFFARHKVPVFPYQYVLVYLLQRGRNHDASKYLLQDCELLSKDAYARDLSAAQRNVTPTAHHYTYRRPRPRLSVYRRAGGGARLHSDRARTVLNDIETEDYQRVIYPTNKMPS